MLVTIRRSRSPSPIPPCGKFIRSRPGAFDFFISRTDNGVPLFFEEAVPSSPAF